MARRRRRFSVEYKQEAIRLVKESGKPIAHVARDLGVPVTSLSGWVKQAEIDAGQGPEGALTSAEKEELRRLRQENRVLRMERDVLKKATAFFAKENR